jgi:hypothetical protein
MTNSLDQIAQQYLTAKATAAAANDFVKQQEDRLKAEMISRGLQIIECENRAVVLIRAERRLFDASVLKNLVSTSIYESVTVAEVRNPLIDAALMVGIIDHETVDQVLTKIPYTQLKVR